VSSSIPWVSHLVVRHLEAAGQTTSAKFSIVFDHDCEMQIIVLRYYISSRQNTKKLLDVN
jgi:hypothetical protein